MRIVVGALAVALLVTGCSHIPGMGSKAAASPSTQATATTAAGTPLAKATGGLDAEVAMPSGFPSDVPIYPKARLTAGAQFVSSGQVAYGMEWETKDGQAAVATYYQKEFNQGDWVLTLKDTSSVWTATIARKTNSHEAGTLAIYNDSPVTVIALSLASTS